MVPTPTVRRPSPTPSTRSTTNRSDTASTFCLARLCFRGIYFPMMGKFAWLKVVVENRRTIFKLITEAIFGRRKRPLDPAYQKAPEVHREASA